LNATSDTNELSELSVSPHYALPDGEFKPLGNLLINTHQKLDHVRPELLVILGTFSLDKQATFYVGAR
jgi:hypothetical protein